jgi:hypothetical protein
VTERKIDSDEAVRLYAHGMSSVALVRHYGVRVDSVLKVLHKAGTPMRPAHCGRATVEPGIQTKLVEAARAGEGPRVAAAHLGISYASARRFIARADVLTGARVTRMRMPTDPASLGYLAGLLDSCGVLRVTAARRNGGKVGLVAIRSIGPEVAHWLETHVGGQVRWGPGSSTGHGRGPVGTWGVTSAQDVWIVLRALLPHLIDKRDLALQVLALCEERLGVVRRGS